MALLGKVVQTTELISSKASKSGESSFILCTKKKGLSAKTSSESEELSCIRGHCRSLKFILLAVWQSVLQIEYLQGTLCACHAVWFSVSEGQHRLS